MQLNFLPAGASGLLLEPEQPHDVNRLLAALQRALEQGSLPGVRELVPAARTVLLLLERPLEDDTALLRAVRALRFTGGAGSTGGHVEIPVVYDGEDLAETARLLGISPEELIRRHGSRDYLVAFSGFAPGFAYLTGGHPELDVPRKASPRVRVPAGAVALAGRYSAVYPGASPGGWQLIGRTAAEVWNPERDPPALLQPGMTVRFTEAGSAAEGTAPQRRSPPAREPASGSAAVHVLSTGLQALLQDGGRPGYAAQGVPASGAADASARQRANRLVGNQPAAPVIEALGGGLELRARGPVTAAVSGASGPLTVTAADGRTVQEHREHAFALDDGDIVRLGPPAAGLRSCVAVRGGFRVTGQLGSASTVLLSGLGPPALRPGDVRAISGDTAGPVGNPETVPLRLPGDGDTVTVEVTPGPRADWFTSAALTLFHGQPWLVTPASGRVGLRLSGRRALSRARNGELDSEGMVRGAVQVPPDGQPVVFLADHPVTGGYPVIACVAARHLDLLAQLPPGVCIRFRPVSPSPATEGGEP